MSNKIPLMAKRRTTDPIIRPLHHFDGARDHAVPIDRLKSLTRAARQFRGEMLGMRPVYYFKACDLVRVPYPTRFALQGACSVPTPLLHILNRLFIIQFQTTDGMKTLLVSPTDLDANRETPYFKRVARKFFTHLPALESVLAPQLGNVAGHLKAIGLTPEDVDYITYDHLHTQDLRRWLGGKKRPSFFPNAKLLVTRQEWDSVRGLLPPQQDWYCPHGADGVPREKIILLDHDVMLGESVALIRTPGHTAGNHSIVTHLPELGLIVTSENGIAADSYAPLHSAIPGLKRYTRDTGVDVILNSNTLEDSIDQYLSMIQEREIAGPAKRDPRFYNILPSSELAAYWLFPGIKPTFSLAVSEIGQPLIMTSSQGNSDLKIASKE